MELSDLLIDAGVSFAGGFAVGISGVTSKRLETIEDAEAILGEDEKKKLKLDENARKNTKKFTLGLNYVQSFIYGTLYTAGATLMHGGNPAERGTVSILSTFAGATIGNGVRKLARSKHKRDFRNVGEIRRNSENAWKYLPENGREIIEGALGELESRIVKGEDPSKIGEELRNKGSITHRMYEAIVKEKRPYTRAALMIWSHDKFKETLDRAVLQKNIVDFYENMPLGATMIVGEPEKAKLKVYEIAGNNLTTYLVDFAGLRIVQKDGVGSSVSMDHPPEISNKEIKRWEGNYKDLALDVSANRDKYTIMFSHPPEGEINDYYRQGLVSMGFIPCFEMNLARKRRQS